VTIPSSSPFASVPHLRWGILGTGNIAGKFATEVAAVADRATLQAVGSREAGKASAFAAKYGVKTSHLGYQEVLDDPAVDAVYISLLNHQHARWSILAAKAGKHILCEKPATMTARELVEVLDAVKQAKVFYMEAYAYRHHPRYAALRKQLGDGLIGDIRLMHGTFSIDGTALDRPRLYTLEHGGGGLMDVGCYPVSWMRWIAKAEPAHIKATGTKGSSGVDEWAAGSLRFPAGATGSFLTGVRCAVPTTAAIYVETGAIEIDQPWRCTPGSAIVLNRPNKGPVQLDHVADGLGQYSREALAVAKWRDARESPDCTWADSLAGMKVLDELRHQVGVWWPGEAAQGAAKSGEKTSGKSDRQEAVKPVGPVAGKPGEAGPGKAAAKDSGILDL
jgi:predicted dehydrogenase